MDDCFERKPPRGGQNGNPQRLWSIPVCATPPKVLVLTLLLPYRLTSAARTSLNARTAGSGVPPRNPKWPKATSIPLGVWMTRMGTFLEYERPSTVAGCLFSQYTRMKPLVDGSGLA